jgi:DNA-binding CsgD family transcriptional regulator
MHDTAVKASIDFAHALTHAEDSEAFFGTALANLTTLIPADHLFWTRTDFGQGVAEIRGDEGTAGSLGQVLGLFGPTHPAIQTYVADPSNLTPRRISDVTDRLSWHRSPIYREGFAAFGAAHQLSLVTSVRPPGVGTGWTLTRSGNDFTIREVALASRLLPALIAAEGMVLSRPVDNPDRSLTQRELVVLSLLAEGLTASAIGRRCGITERTVRKYLSSIYEKLHCSDRLMAAKLGTELGLIQRRATR